MAKATYAKNFRFFRAFCGRIEKKRIYLMYLKLISSQVNPKGVTHNRAVRERR